MVFLIQNLIPIHPEVWVINIYKTREKGKNFPEEGNNENQSVSTQGTETIDSVDLKNKIENQKN